MTEEQLEYQIEQATMPWFERDDCPPNDALVGWIQYYMGEEDHDKIKQQLINLITGDK